MWGGGAQEQEYGRKVWVIDEQTQPISPGWDLLPTWEEAGSEDQ